MYANHCTAMVVQNVNPGNVTNWILFNKKTLIAFYTV